eukprot:CAMPEP_0172587586 /NCGR_PEP_ID=MMETSP1068-20121228/6612_1 /TAXON_ID=35684 /ORGANISM="Pseudopedinella elastica, Strain CCMP716" /LENGTH=287 /DNA_ID=CAMNT_0013382651 /DNA_START=192 /DNA_END=1055 /DNA_ORIENTATION=+
MVGVEGWQQPARPVRSSGPAHRQPAGGFVRLSAKRGKGLGEVSNLGGKSKPGKGLGVQPAAASTKADPTKQAEADAAIAAIAAECEKEEKERDLAALEASARAVAALSSSEPGLGAGDRAASLAGDWRLVWVSGDEALACVGTGLHKLPLTLLEDMFLSLGKPAIGAKLEVAEILRILGPFPNVRNTLAGTWKPSADGKFGISLVYDTMVDGNGGVIKAPDGSERRKVPLTAAYASPGEALCLQAGDGGLLVFAAEADLDGALKALRVDRPEDWDEPKEPFKLPWQK